MQAGKIQRAMRKFRKQQRASRFEASQSMKSTEDHSLTEVTSVAKPSVVALAVTKLLHPVRKAQEAANKVANLFKTQELIPKADEKKFTNAVLKYQLKSILQGNQSFPLIVYIFFYLSNHACTQRVLWIYTSPWEIQNIRASTKCN